MLLAGLVGFACSQEAQESLEIGTAQVELRSDLALSEGQHPTTASLDEKNPDSLGQSSDPIQATRRISLTAQTNYSQNRAYRSVKRYEFLPALLMDPKTQKNFAQKGNVQVGSGTLADKPWVRAGKGFGVAVGGGWSRRKPLASRSCVVLFPDHCLETVFLKRQNFWSR